MLRWLRRRRPRAIPEPLWQQTLAGLPFIAARPAAELARLRELAGGFLADKEFQGAGGLAVTDEMAVAIALQAVLPVLHLGLGWYDDFVGVVLHPGQVVARRSQMDEAGVVHDWQEELAGEAMEGGPVMLSWSDVAAAGDSAHQGYNLVIHEFVHKIDMRDGQADGCPPLPSRAARDAWLATLQSEWEAFRERVVVAERFGGEPTWLDPYGAAGIDEFFAVASEAYFVNRPRFEKEFDALVRLFDSFYQGPGQASRAAAP